MEAVTPVGYKIVESKRMKQSGRMRYIIEFTEEDSQKYAGIMAVAEVMDVVFRGSWEPMESENVPQVTPEQNA